MIHFPVLRTRRLTIQLRELTLGEALAIASIPSDQDQAATTAMLRACVQKVEPELDPADWTVQERMMAVAHYLASTLPSGPDFEVGENGHFSDYLDASSDHTAAMVSVGELGGDKWSVRQLTGRMAESIERLEGETKDGANNPLPPRLHWLVGGLAAQMIRDGETVPDVKDGEGAFDDWMMSRMRTFAAYPESAFVEMLMMYRAGCAELAHLFDIDFSHEGVVAMPKEGAAEDLPPARFPARAALSELALGMAKTVR